MNVKSSTLNLKLLNHIYAYVITEVIQLYNLYMSKGKDEIIINIIITDNSLNKIM